MVRPVVFCAFFSSRFSSHVFSWTSGTAGRCPSWMFPEISWSRGPAPSTTSPGSLPLPNRSPTSKNSASPTTTPKPKGSESLPLPLRPAGRWFLSILREINSKQKERRPWLQSCRTGNLRSCCRVGVFSSVSVFAHVRNLDEIISDIRDTLGINDSGALSSLNLANNKLVYRDDMSGIIALTKALPKW